MKLYRLEKSLKNIMGKCASVGLKLTVEKCTLGQEGPVCGGIGGAGRAGVGSAVGRVHGCCALGRRRRGSNMIVAIAVADVVDIVDVVVL